MSTGNHEGHSAPDAQGAYRAPDGGPDAAPTREPSPTPVTAAVVAESQASLREGVVERERDQFGGVKVGSAFFGWLAANGMAVLLTAVVTATGAAVGLGTEQLTDVAGENAGTVGVVGAIALIVVLFVAYFCGGYVAGRMARFNGAKQGLAVWLWSIVIAIVVAIIVAIVGSQYNVLANLNSFPRIPIDEGSLTAGSIVTLILVVIVSLVGAVLGGIAGMRFHRRVDRVGLGR
jgi:amino acid transporter